MTAPRDIGTPPEREARDVAEEQCRWWRAQQFSPVEAWLALGQPSDIYVEWSHVERFMWRWLLRNRAVRRAA